MYIFQNNAYLAIIGDIKQSKKIEDRGYFQTKLKEVLKQINKIYNEEIASDFTITLGDEFQGLLKNGNRIMDIIHYIRNEVYPVEIRFALGIGTITTEINPRMAIGSDGPGYYMARESMNFLKETEKKNSRANTNLYIRIQNNLENELLLNVIFKLMYSIEKKWTNKQREVINYLIFNKENQMSVANHFKVSQSNIQQIMHSGNYYVYKEAFDSVNYTLSKGDRDA